MFEPVASWKYQSIICSVLIIDDDFTSYIFSIFKALREGQPNYCRPLQPTVMACLNVTMLLCGVRLFPTSGDIHGCCSLVTSMNAFSPPITNLV